MIVLFLIVMCSIYWLIDYQSMNAAYSAVNTTINNNVVNAIVALWFHLGLPGFFCRLILRRTSSESAECITS